MEVGDLVVAYDIDARGNPVLCQPFVVIEVDGCLMKVRETCENPREAWTMAAMWHKVQSATGSA